MNCKSFAIRVAVAVLVFAALGGADAVAADHAPRPRILTSFLPVHCFTLNVVGDLAQVEQLLPANVDPHDYTLSIRDLRRIQSADLFLLNGLGVEDWLAGAARNARRVVEVAPQEEEALICGTYQLSQGRIQRVAPREDASHGDAHEHHRHHHGHAGHNPHVWLDPIMACQMVSNIAAAVAELDPSNAGRYFSNASHFIQRLEALDREITEATVSLRDRPFLTYHDAFPYFVRRYGLNLVGVIERIPDVDPSARYLANLLRMAREQEARALFVEPGPAPRLAQRISGDIGLRLAELDALESGPPAADAYENGMRRNIAALRKALQ